MAQSDLGAHALSGAVGGIASMALTYPLITISTRNQVSRGKKDGYNGQIDCFKRILAEEGIAGFYSGVSSALFGIAVTNGVYYYWYEFSKNLFAKPGASLSTLENMGAGAMAGVATSLLTNPIWVVNTRLTVKSTVEEPSKTIGKGGAKPSPIAASSASVLPTLNESASAPVAVKKLGFAAAVMKIFKEEGIAGFFQGIFPALILVTNPIIQYTVFEKLKEKWVKWVGDRALGPLDFFLLGAISKLAATSATYPYIVIKSRMQLKQTDESLRYKSPLDGFRQILKNEGVKGLYKGIESKLVQSVLTSAFLFAFKEELFGVAIQVLVALGMRNATLAR